MRIPGRCFCHRRRDWLRRQIAGCLALVLVATFVIAVPLPQQSTNAGQQTESAASARSQSQEPDNSDKKLTAKADLLEPMPDSFPTDTLPDSPGSLRSQGIDNNQQAGGEQPSPQPQQNGTQEPAGTAAAPSVKVTGVAASQPAGAAIAPGKQRRARSILIKVGVILGAAVAVGTVVALSSASPSRPSH
jgi:hypothetical protein